MISHHPRNTVIGGEYEDMTWQKVKAGKEVKFGPFATYEEAYDCWKANMWLNVDNALFRLKIV
jgi:hypothetical protein